MIKYYFTLFVLTFSMVGLAQESTLLRLNYNEGDQYAVIMNMQMDMGENMSMDMKMDMAFKVKDITDDIYNTETSITKIVMDMSQGGMDMSYDSTLKDEELNEVQKMMKTQFAPLLGIIISSKMNKMGETLDVTIEPDIPSASQFKDNSSSIVYPENPVSVGDTWSIEKDTKGMKLTTIYTVKSIESNIVVLEIGGSISGSAEGTISGNVSVDRKSGVSKEFNMVMDMQVSGQQLKTILDATTVKI